MILKISYENFIFPNQISERIISKVRTLELNFFETTHRNFLKFCKTVSLVMMIHFQEKKWGVKLLPTNFLLLA